MSDLTYDAIICGGGNKALMLAMYLTKYGGMKCGIFERRHEIGGGLATEEIAAPGFRGNTHANIIMDCYYTPLYRDFPEFWEYGGMIDQYKCSDGTIFMDSGKCLSVYGLKHDPTQEKTAEQIARFSQKDADTFLKIHELRGSDENLAVMSDFMMNPFEWQERPEFLERKMALFAKMEQLGLDPMSIISVPPIEGVKRLFESPEMQYTTLRFLPSGVTNVRDLDKGSMTLTSGGAITTLCFARGGTHMIAHACHQWLVQNGAEFHLNKTVTKVLHDGKKAVGIELHDGMQVNARKMVVTAGMSAPDLIEVTGRDVFGPEICKKIDNLSYNNIGNIMWYSFAIHEAPKYEAEAFNPDIHETFWLGLAPSADVEHIGIECDEAKKGKIPSMDHFNPVVWCHSLVDPSYAPPGKHIAQHEMQGPGALDLTEDEYLRFKDQHAADMMEYWEKFAPNMNWNNIIGIDTNSPFDHRRLKNLDPHGNFAGIDKSESQDGPNRPCPELANHRTPISNLYCTGGYWHIGGEATVAGAYNCYKIIASDMDLGKPWEEPDKKEPESLIAEYPKFWDRMRKSFPVK